MMNCLGSSCGALLGGVLYDIIGLTAVFKIAGMIMLSSTGLFLCVRKSITENKSMV